MKSSVRAFNTKHLMFKVLTILFLVMVLEAICYAGLAIIQRSLDVRNIIHEQQQWVKDGKLDQQPGLTDTGVGHEVLHPYMGYVLRRKTSVDPYGFGNQISPVQKKSKDKVIVAVLGGSVAQQLFRAAIRDLADELKKTGPFHDKEIVPISLALGGYKQPQQLMAVNYLLSIGGEFDIVINLDGFNEVALPLVENRMMKVSAAFPRDWRMRVDPMEEWAAEPILMMNWLSLWRYKVSQVFLLFPLSRSYSVMAVWSLIDNILYRRICHYHRRFVYIVPQQELGQPGAYPDFSNEEGLYDFIAGVWQRSSKSLEALSRTYDFRYFHFLQPNLHDEDMKSWSAREMSLKAGASPFRDPVNDGYPHLKRKGSELLKAGIRFYDFTGIFKNHAETIYADDCCHLRVKGYRILAHAIGKVIADNYDSMQSNSSEIK